jgi:endoglucanase
MNMKPQSICTAFMAVLLTFTANAGNRFSPKLGSRKEFVIEKGVNIAHWLSQSNIRGEQRARMITKKDFDALASYGFDHVRLPVDEEQIFHADGTIDEEAMSLAHNAIEWCREDGLRVVFDLHIIRSHHFNGGSSNTLWSDPAQQDKLIDLWMKLSDELKEYPNSLVAYDLLNEAVAPEDQQWSALAARLIKAIRQREKKRTIVLGSNSWDNVRKIKLLEVPEKDKNIILQFHFYEPFLLTHYQASWTNQARLNLSVPPQYPGRMVSDEVFAELSNQDKQIVKNYRQDFDKAKLLETWQSAIDFAKQHGLKLYCGEFGCLRNADEKSRVAWIKDVVDLCRSNCIAYSLWAYNDSGFTFIQSDGSINQPMLDALVK